MQHTPMEFVSLLSEKVIGQVEAKKTIAIALRNRWRRTQLASEIRKDITPKNILLIGSTGVGKTAIIRAMADLIDAPMVKVEATKYTQIGYVGASINGMIEQLALEGYNKFNQLKKSKYSSENDYKSFLLVKKANIVINEINRIAKEEINLALKEFYESDIEGIDGKRRKNFFSKENYDNYNKDYLENDYKLMNWVCSDIVVSDVAMLWLNYLPIYLCEGITNIAKKKKTEQEVLEALESCFNKSDFLIKLFELIRMKMLRKNKAEEEGTTRDFLKCLEKKVGEDVHKNFQAYIDFIYTFLPDDSFDYNEETKEVSIMAKFKNHIEFTENMGIVFIDEIDKLADKGNSNQDNVGKIGVQRDLLALLDGTTVETPNGIINTENLLFIAAGAFHSNEVTDLMPELLGRLPINVKLEEMNKEMLNLILLNQKVSPIKQYIQLLEVDNIKIFIDDATIAHIADLADTINKRHTNMGARTLHAVVDKIFAKYAYEMSASDEARTIHITQSDVSVVRKEITGKYYRDFARKYMANKFKYLKLPS